ncbi:MAG: hypothetical protein K9G26_10410 [Emcibacter sp.]|nr:hypothetical protein [Emcibacter sp.]
MLEFGKTHSLIVLKHVDFGVYVGEHPVGEIQEEILLPKRYLPENSDEWEIGCSLPVFLYFDSEDRPIATTEIPFAEVGDCAHLSVVEKGSFGSFLDWGLSKDLFVPFKEQRVPMEAGRSYVVYLYLDNTGRIAASSLLSKYLPELNEGQFKPRQEVDLLIASRSDLGYKAVINGSHLGLIHNSDIFRPIKIGDKFKGYIGEIRIDDRINITLQKPTDELRKELPEIIMDYIIQKGGSINLTDKSKPEDINAIFHVSKSNYKNAIGKLYKDRKIIISGGVITLAHKA